MNQENLRATQKYGSELVDKQPLSKPDDATKRAELLAEAREQRLLEMVNGAVFWGIIKAHLLLAVIGVALWFLASSVLGRR